jgi:hypothetical protein
VIVVMPRLFPLGPDNYAKLSRWPDFAHFLDSCYSLQVQRNFTMGTGYRSGYRLYLQKPACTGREAVTTTGAFY